MPSGGVFSGFTKHDLSRLGPINKLTPGGVSGTGSGSLGLNPFLIPPGSRLPTNNNNNHNVNGNNKGRIAAFPDDNDDGPTQQTELSPPQTFLNLLENLSNVSCWQEATSEDYENRKIVSMAITR